MNDSVKFDLDELLHPGHAFAHPSDVVGDPDLSLNEKRAILASWASDACAIEAAPELRSAPHGNTVRFDDVMEALRALDRQSALSTDQYRRVPRQRRMFRKTRQDDQTDNGAPLQ